MASSAVASMPEPLHTVEELSSIVSLHRPTATARRDPSSPRLILLFAWMGAQDRHVAKYIAGYQALHPTSPILVVMCPLGNGLFHGKARREVAPAVSALRSLIPDGEGRDAGEGKEPEMMLHLFSNGGCMSFDRFLEVYREDVGSEELPRNVCALDSCPGKFTWARGHRAISAALPPWVSPLVHILVVVEVVMDWFRASAGERGRWGMALNKEVAVKNQTGRVYLYSDGDEMVAAEHVEAHAAEAREAGMGDAVRLENFGENGHVTHMRADPKRYWGALKDLWEGA
ncbi:uncharacterized protein DNG_07993 [Cephalotrichum gorgonifer]|uniref:DUF829 domain-containing protein n=1 Tax=Cephalotrichum gorgonifer TaxID=2041049 RepID=A0AAE8N2N2_9PEZI|nr:uncharacterized protein DNG_07993 [Cephalotrichum gorgonifer]